MSLPDVKTVPPVPAVPAAKDPRGEARRTPPPPQAPLSVEAQIEKLSSDLVEVYEALTMVYGSVAVLGGLFRLEDITAYLVSRSVEAVGASGAALFFPTGPAGPGAPAEPEVFERVDGHGDLGERLRASAPGALLQKRRALFVNAPASAAHFDDAGQGAPLPHLLAAPLETGGRSLGVLVLERSAAEPFTTGDAKLIGALCGVTAVAIANFLHYRAVNDEREMLQRVMSESGDGIVVADEDWNALFVNAQARAFLGRDSGAVLDALAAFRLDRDEATLREPAVPEFLAFSRDPRRPLVLRGKALSARTGLDLRGSRPIRVLFLRDVTREQREADAQRDFLSLASHKLRTPLTMILGLLPIAREEAADAAFRAEAFQGIEGGAEQLRALVDGILQYVEFREGTRSTQEVSLAPLLDEVLDEVARERKDREIRARLCVEEGLPPVRGSRHMLRVLLKNLVDNAVKFTPGRAAEVDIELSRTGERRLRLVVEDHGEGMTPELRQKLFQPFAQRDEDFTGQAEGAGFGLLLVHQAVLRHGGSIEVESALGRGTRFTIVLPEDGREASS